MMPAITVGQLRFTFPDTWQASQFDEWKFYLNQFQKVCSGTKAIDILALDSACCWLIEVKDYRQHPRTNTIDLPNQIATKVRDSLAALFAASVNANDSTEKSLAQAAVRCTRLRVVFHLEQPAKHSKLHPRAIDPANIQLRLRQLLKAIDPHPLVLESTAMRNVAWTVQ